jgi:hypothetical protein
MLAYILAVLVGTSSIGLFITAFLYPEIHRKPDFIWSGVGLFYALFLWLYADGVTGGILVGQTTSVALLGWFGWQTIKLRRQIAPMERQTAMVAAKTPSTNSAKIAAERLAKVTKAESTATPTVPQNPPKPPSAAAQRPGANPPKAQNPATTTARTVDRSPNPSAPATPKNPASRNPATTPTAPTNAAPAPTSAPATPVASPNPANPSTPPTSVKGANPAPPAPATTPVPVIPNIPINRPPVSPEPLPAQPIPIRQIQQPERQNTAPPADKSTPAQQADSIDLEDTGAWIKLEPVKPAPTPSEPLGTAMQPPQAKDRPEPSSPLPKTGDLDALLDEIETTVKADFKLPD